VKRIVSGSLLLALVCLLPACAPEKREGGPLIATGPLPGVFIVRVTGIGKAPDDKPAGQARLMAEAAAEADALRRLTMALYNRDEGILTGARRVATHRIEGGWSIVTVEMALPTREDYLIVLDRLAQMESPLKKAVRMLPPARVVETIISN